MLARGHPDAASIFVVHHHAVGGRVHPIAIGISDRHHVIRPDIAPTVLLVKQGNRELVEVNVLVAIDVLEDGAFVHFHRRDQRELLAHPLAEGLHHIGGSPRLGKAQGVGETAGGVGRARQHAGALGVTGHLVEQERRGFSLAGFLANHLRKCPHLQVPAHALKALELAHLVDAHEKIPKILVADIRFIHLRRLRIFRHGSIPVDIAKPHRQAPVRQPAHTSRLL